MFKLSGISLPFAILAAMGIYCSPLAARESERNTNAPLIKVNLRGNLLIIPSAYLYTEDLSSYRDMITTDVVRLSLDWPSLKPFVPAMSNVMHVRTRTELSVIFDPSGTRNDHERKVFFERIRADWAAKHVTNTDRFGLRRLSLPEGVTSPYKPDDVLYPREGPLLTLIRCAPESEVEPDSPEAEKLRTLRRLVKVPYCTQHFFIPELKDVVVRATYRRVHLKDWKSIEGRISDLTRSMMKNSSPH